MQTLQGADARGLRLRDLLELGGQSPSPLGVFEQCDRQRAAVALQPLLLGRECALIVRVDVAEVVEPALEIVDDALVRVGALLTHAVLVLGSLVLSPFASHVVTMRASEARQDHRQ